MGIERYGEVLRRLRRVRRGEVWWRALCPAHQTGDDHRRGSLALREGEHGHLIVECHAGCSFEEIKQALGLRSRDFRPADSYQPFQNQCAQDQHPRRPSMSMSLQDQPTQRETAPQVAPAPAPQTAPQAAHRVTAHGVTAEYVYRDERGAPLYRVLRYEPKDFRQQRYVSSDHGAGQGSSHDSSQWQWGLGDARRVLYRLDELVTADPKRLVWVVEGEKDADRLASLGLIATTCPMGAGKWHEGYSACLHGRHVAIIPDWDDPGQHHAWQVAEALRAWAASIKILVLPGLADKQDVSDWLDAGHTKQDLASVLRLTRFTKPPEARLNAPVPPTSVAPSGEAAPDATGRALAPADAAPVETPPSMAPVAESASERATARVMEPATEPAAGPLEPRAADSMTPDRLPELLPDMKPQSVSSGWDSRAGMKAAAAAIFGRADYLGPEEWLLVARHILDRLQTRLAQEAMERTQRTRPQGEAAT